MSNEHTQPDLELAPPAAPPMSVERLSENLRALVEKTLLEGGTLEDAAERVAEAGGPEILPDAVARFFNSRADLQVGRVMGMMAAVDEIKAGATDPTSVEARMVDAAIMQGLQRVERKTARLSAAQAVNARVQRENFRLRQDLLKLRVQKQQKEELLMTRRADHEIERTRLLRVQIRQLVKLMETDKKDLKPALIDKIHEVYGLAEMPEVPVAAEPTGN